MNELQKMSLLRSLRLIAAVADNMALKVERGQTWPSDLERAALEIAEALRSLPKGQA